jgi:2-oxo-4-hydroxy-4-carboxy-5-ureidoimidazoline decarboxylase
MTGAAGDGLVALNGWPPATAEDRLRSCCAAPGWAGRLTGDRPYPDSVSLHAAADTALAGASWQDILVALSAHPRIGDRHPVRPVDGQGSQESSWSREEQRAAATATDAARAELVAANLAYERRFDHVFLICATGRTTEEISAELRRRLDNDPTTEQAIVRGELAKIVHLRLDKLLAEAASEGPAGPVTISTHVLDASRGRPATGLDVRVDLLNGGAWVAVGGGRTGDDGRIGALLGESAAVGTYRLVFGTGAWFEAAGVEGIYPEVSVVARVAGGHWHLPLLLGPYSYSTYRGS